MATQQNPLDSGLTKGGQVVGIVKEPQRDGVAIEGRTGNFLFTVGSIGSGKSTLQNFLVHRLHADENIHFDRTSVSEADLNTMVRKISAGILPERTEQGSFREFNVAFGQHGRPRLDFSFIEIAGEDIESIVPGKQKQPRLHELLVRYLRQGGVNKRFAFVSDASRNRLGKGSVEEDIFFDTLIRYLLSNTGVGLKSLNILFIAAKWDVVQHEYTSVRQYFRTNFPQTRSIIQAAPNIRANYMPFSVGDVFYETKESGEVVARLRARESKYIDMLISWIYHSFTSRTLRGYPTVVPTLWERIKNSLA
jgi:energy-coupling factor transporter ATP-binding protein EcfA2